MVLFSKKKGSLREEQEGCEKERCWRGTDEEFYASSLGFFKKKNIAKRGQNRLQSKDGTINVSAEGGVYDGIDISVDTKKIAEYLKETDSTKGPKRATPGRSILVDHGMEGG